MTPDQAYIAHLEQETIRLARERDEIKAAVIVWVMKMNCGRDATEAAEWVQAMCRERSADVMKLIKEWY